MESVESIISLFEPFYDQDATPIDEMYPGPSFPRIDVHLLNDLFILSKETLKKNKALLEISSPMIVVGDLHGNLIDFLKILYYFGTPPKSRYLFLGDFVDRGRYSVNAISLILSLMVKYPNDIYLIRGNHEFSHINRAYGFFDECMNTYGSEQVWNQFQEVFSYIPLAAVIGGSVFCVHGGLSPLLKSLNSIRDLPLPIPNYFNNTMISDLVWSDPVDTVRGFQLNHRGSGQIFGPDVVEDFLRFNKLKIMIRGHQCTLAGFKPFANFMGVTVFSSSNYCSSICNKCGVVSIKDRDVSFYNIEESEMGLSPSASMCLPIDGDVGLKRIFRTISRPDFHKEISPTINSPLQEQGHNNESDEEEEEEDEDEFNFQLRNPPTKNYTFQTPTQYQTQQQYNSMIQMRTNLLFNQRQKQINDSIIQQNVPIIPTRIGEKEEEDQQQGQNVNSDIKNNNNTEEEENEENKENSIQANPEQQEEAKKDEKSEENQQNTEIQNQPEEEKVEQSSEEQKHPEEEESEQNPEQKPENPENLEQKPETENQEQKPEEQQPIEEEQKEKPEESQQSQELQKQSEDVQNQPEEQARKQTEEEEHKEQQMETKQEEEEQKEQEIQQKQPDQEEDQDHPQEEQKAENEQQQQQESQPQNEQPQPEEEQKQQLPDQEGKDEQSTRQEQQEIDVEKDKEEQTKEPQTPKNKHVKLALPPIPKAPGSPSSISVTFGNEPRTTHQNFLQRSQSVIDSLGGV